MIGQVLNGTYQLIDLIGSGGYADVYRARDLRSDAIVAVKMLHAHVAREPDIAARFEREVFLARRLQTPYVARILDAGRDPDSPPYMVMDLVQGRTLTQIVEQRGALPISEAVEIIDQLLGALKQAHPLGIVHRDLKPHNLMVDTAGRVRVLDFGLSRVIGAGAITADGQLLGTPEYMAPEQLAGQPIDARADLYAVGAVLYHLLAGRPPYLRTTDTDLWEMVRRARREPPPPIQQLRPDTPLALAAVVERAMARDPDQRYASAFEVQHALAVATGEDPPTPQSLRAPGSTRPPEAAEPPPSPAAAPARSPQPLSARPRVDDQQATVVLPILAPQSQAAPGPNPPPAQPSSPPLPAPTQLTAQQPTRPPSGADQTRIMDSAEAPPAYGRPPSRPASAGAPHPGPPQGPSRADLARAPAVLPRRSRMPSWQLAGLVVVALLLVGFGAAVGRFASVPLRTAAPTPTTIAEATAIPTATAGITAAAPKPAAAADLSPTVVAVAPPPSTTVPPPATSPPVVANAIPKPSENPGTASPAPTVAPDRPSPPAPPSEAEVILSDTFDRTEGGLLTRTSPRPNDYAFAYEGGEYVIKKVNPTLPAAPIVFLRGEYTDTVIAVDVRIVGEAGARYAFVVCRDKSEGGQTRQYRASIVPEGRRVILSHWADGGQKVLAETRDNPAIQIGNATNRLELRCAGSKIEIIVNGKTVVSVDDTTLASGEHGLGAGTFSGVEGSLEARFDNLEVRKP